MIPSALPREPANPLSEVPTGHSIKRTNIKRVKSLFSQSDEFYDKKRVELDERAQHLTKMEEEWR